MASHYPTHSTNPSSPLPPPHLFRLITRLSPTTYLCLPRSIPLSPSPPPLPSPSLLAFSALPRSNQRLHQQTWTLSHPRSDVLVWMLQHNAATLLPPRIVDLLPHVVIVSTGPNVRRECEILEEMSVFESASKYVPTILRAQITSVPESTWVVSAPMFGTTVRAFGERVKETGGMAGWMVAHVFLALVESVEFVNEAGYAHGGIKCENLVLDVYPRVLWHRYRGYPDVVLRDFSGAAGIDGESRVQDARAVLKVMQEVIVEYSDAAVFVGRACIQGEMVTDDPTLLVLRDVQMLLATAQPTIPQIREQLEARLVDLRHTGPDQLPRSISQLIHDDLATNAEYEHALREPKVLKFDAKHEKFVRIVANDGVQMGSGGHSGMKTNRILVARFTTKKKGFLRVVGEDDREESDMDIDGTYESDDGYELSQDGMDIDVSVPPLPKGLEARQ